MSPVSGNPSETAIPGNPGKDGISDGKCGVKFPIAGRPEAGICSDGSPVTPVGNI